MSHQLYMCIIRIPMSIQMTKQSSLQSIIASVKEFKRTGQKITELIRQNHNQQALTLLQKQQKNAINIEYSLKQCEEGYLNPQVAKRLMIIRNQFKQQRSKLAKLFHAVRVQSEEENEQSNKKKQQLEEYQGFDYQLESRLLKQKQESLTQVHKKINNINTIMIETRQMAYGQGQKLDLVSDHLQKSKQNVVESNKHLQQANKLSTSSNKRCIWIVVVGMAILCVILLLVLLACLWIHLFISLIGHFGNQKENISTNLSQYRHFVCQTSITILLLRHFYQQKLQSISSI